MLIIFLFILFNVNKLCLGASEQCYDIKNSFQDLCDKVNCSSTSECVISKDGKTADCKCIDHCYSYGDTIDKQEVCGLDGKNYKNLCELRKFSCNSAKEIQVKYIGKCDPCHDIQCLPNQFCIVDDNRKASCRCDDNCNINEINKICASDGQTYPNECTLRVQACKLRKPLRILYHGECKSFNNSDLCEKANCTIHELCEIDLNNQPTCVCSSNCPLVYTPICGSNKKNYDSICHLRQESCLTKQEISISFYGFCEEDNLCSSFQCPFYGICTYNSTISSPNCECPKCTLEYKPVCASNGLTYSNLCSLKRESCLTNQNITLSYNGICRKCKSLECKYYSTCQSIENHEPKCVCLFNCSKIENLVCGNNGQIYFNECELQKHACETKDENLIKFNQSLCDICSNVHCKYNAHCYMGKCICPIECPEDLFEPVCSNFGKTFSNECELRKFSCLESMKDENKKIINYKKLDNFTIEYFGECNDRINGTIINENLKHIPIHGKSSVLISGFVASTSCDTITCKYGENCYYNEQGIPSCLCTFNCPTDQIEIICGSDDKLYLNECKLNEAICLKQSRIKVVKIEKCLINQKNSICNNSLPLVDKKTQKFKECSFKENLSLNCPNNYTCIHHNKIFSSISAFLNNKNQLNFCCENFNIDFDEKNLNKCNCNKLGSKLPIKCDIKTGKCLCKKGVGGLKCDRCEPGYWALNKLSQSNNGCLPCECNKIGSIREDCDQQNGRCMCKVGFSGMKCDICSDRKKLIKNGCIDENLLKVHNDKCNNIKCKFGATCKELENGFSQCVCQFNCKKTERSSKHFKKIVKIKEDQMNKKISNSLSLNKKIVNFKPCETISNLNECELRILSCRFQKKIIDLTKSLCLENNERINNLKEIVTQNPVRRSTLEKIDKENTRLFDYESISLFTTSSSLIENTLNFFEINEHKIKLPEIPMFYGQSFIKMACLEAYSSLRIEIHLISYTDNGIILYNGQTKTGDGDFICLTINNGYIEYRFNLGSGVSTIKFKEKIVKYKLTKVIISRYYKKGTLIVDNYPEITIFADGELKSLNLNENLYIGNIQSNYTKVYENLNFVRNGFIGCLNKLVIDKTTIKFHEIDLDYSLDDEEFLSNQATSLADNNEEIKFNKLLYNFELIGSCDGISNNKINYCKRFNPCSKGKICINLPNNTFNCICPNMKDCLLDEKNNLLLAKFNKNQSEPNYSSMKVYTLDFWNNSWLKFKTLTNVARAFVIELWFLSRMNNGLLIYNSQKSSFNNQGDFLSLSLKNSNIEYKFNLGSKIPNVSGVSQILSDEKITLNDWHRVKITRMDTFGTMQIDNGKIYSVESKGKLSELNLDEPFFIGGFENRSLKLNQEIGLIENFNGAIQRLIINGEHLVGYKLLNTSVEQNNVVAYEGPPCSNFHTKCENQSECIPFLNEFICKCKNSSQDKFCKIN